ncbi:MAG: isoprenylcysteine carboxylmethyltransferase family protein [Vulcanimicrobiota bacterium]
MRQWFFKWRGALMVPLAVVIIVFGKPTFASYIIGIIIASVGELIRVWGVGYAGKTTRAQEVKAPFLVTAGPYAYVRNPLYLGNAITGLGFVLMACLGISSWKISLILWILYLLFYITVYGTIIPLEEEFLKKTFGDTYTEYCREVPPVFPAFKPYAKQQGTFSWTPVMKGESQTLIMFFLFSVIMALKIPEIGAPLYSKFPWLQG